MQPGTSVWRTGPRASEAPPHRTVHPSLEEAGDVLIQYQALVCRHYPPPPRLDLPAREGARRDRFGRDLARACRACGSPGPEQVAAAVLDGLEEYRGILRKDVEAALVNDPAARDQAEVEACYPGIRAITGYRLAHFLLQAGVELLPRMICEFAHSRTGIDIHPGARIGRSFFIDHGTGVVVGETTWIGDRVTLYQGVTLGARNFPRDVAGRVRRLEKRHPTIEDDVVLYAHATVLGGETIIGRGSVVGANVWLTESVPPGTVVLQKSPRYLDQDGALPAPVSESASTEATRQAP